jgi:hypothetical protein
MRRRLLRPSVLFSLFFLLNPIPGTVSCTEQLQQDPEGTATFLHAASAEGKSIYCGPFYVEWANCSARRGSIKYATLVVKNSEGKPIFEVNKRAWSPATLDVLWCQDILGDDEPALGYTLYSGGIHCC